MKARSTLLGLFLGFGLLLFAAGAPAEALAQCCTTPTPPTCCTTPTPPTCCTNTTPPTCCHTINVPGVTVNVASTVVVNAGASAVAGARAGASSSAGSVVYYGGGGGYGYYSPPVTTGLVQLNVEGGRKRTAYEASRTRTRRVIIQAVCIDDRQVPHPASQVRPERDVADDYDGEMYRCIAGTWLQWTVADFDGKIDFSGGKTMACDKNQALYHAPGGKVECRRQKPARDCNERSLLRRFGAGIKVLTFISTETYTAYREEEEASSYSSSMSLDGGVGGIAY